MRLDRLRPWALWVVPVLLAAWGVWRICVALPEAAAEPPRAAPELTAPPTLASSAPSVFALGRSEPTRVTIPAINVRAKLDKVGLNRDGTVENPSYRRPHNAAWYHPGPAPGEIGPAVILGHFDAKTAGRTADTTAVFFRLRELKSGAEVTVTRADGQVAMFRVDSVERFAKASFPTERVYGAVGYPALRLITCGGRFDGKHREYLDNIVVFAHLVGAKR